MSGVSKFYKINGQLMLEYTPADLNDILQHRNGENEYRPLNYYIYEGKDTNIYYTLEIVSTGDLYSNQAKLIKFPDESDSEYTFPGIGNDVNLEDSLDSYAYDSSKYTYDNSKDYYADTIKIYFIYGYILDSLQGFSLKVKAKAGYYRYDYKVSERTGQYLKDEYGNYIPDTDAPEVYDETYITILDYFLPKEVLKDAIHYLPQPMYLNAKFYDRYIEVKFPSYYDIGLNNNIDVSLVTSTSEKDEKTLYTIKYSEPLLIDFATVDEDSTTENITHTDKNILYNRKFILNAETEIGIQPNSNSDYFNIRIYKNPYENNILYYPIYGTNNEYQDLNLDIMNSIENNQIPMLDKAFYDLEDDNENFIELYGKDARKWIVYNELNIQYCYSFYIADSYSKETTAYTYNEYITSVIDYDNKSELDGEFWRLTFVPNIKDKNNMYCKAVIIQYTCRLVNRCNGAEAIRTAGYTLKDTDLNDFIGSKINLTGQIVTYKVVNRITNNNVYSTGGEVKYKDKYIRSYYDATDLVIKDTESGLSYAQGLMTLYLKHSSTNYCFRIYTLNSDNVRVPYNLSGPYTYKLVFPGSENTKLEIMPNIDNSNSNLGIGQIVYYITEDLVKRIMNVSSNDRYFAIVISTTGNDALQSTLYEGKVAYYS